MRHFSTLVALFSLGFVGRVFRIFRSDFDLSEPSFRVVPGPQSRTTLAALKDGDIGVDIDAPAPSICVFPASQGTSSVPEGKHAHTHVASSSESLSGSCLLSGPGGDCQWAGFKLGVLPGILKSAGPPRETGPGTETSKKRDFSDSESELEVQSAGGTLGLAQGSPRGPLST